MICCKIIADYNNEKGNFSQLLNSLGKNGELLWENNVLYFSETEHDHLSETKIKNIIKKCGYSKFFIDIFSQENKPNETEDINGWIYDKLIKINYRECENASQKVFKEISIGLDILDEEIKQLQIKKQDMIKEAKYGRRKK